MAIDHEMWPGLAARTPTSDVGAERSGAGRFGDHDGMSLGRADAGVEADLPAMFGQPGGAGLQILFMLWLGGDAGEAKKIAQLSDETGLVAFQVIEHQLHGV